jgi:hypothetical protein
MKSRILISSCVVAASAATLGLLLAPASAAPTPAVIHVTSHHTSSGVVVLEDDGPQACPPKSGDATVTVIGIHGVALPWWAKCPQYTVRYGDITVGK